MNKEIKFRAWDKKNKIMTYNPINCINFDGQLLLNDGQYHDIKKTDYVLMQFTGLEDKNGKEIYEGDIVNAQYNISSFFKKVCVYFENGCFYVDDKNPKQNLSIGYFFREKKEIEVIGNLYENPELLKENLK